MDLPSFETFADDIFKVLSHFKVWRKRCQVSRVVRLIDTCLVSCFMMLDALLILSELTVITDCYDLPSLAAHINPLFLHFLGLFKWTYCIIHHDDIVDLVKCMERCHDFAKCINKTDTGYSSYKENLQKCQKNSIMFMHFWFFVAIGGVMQWCINPLIYDFYEEYYDGKVINSTALRRLPYPGSFPLEINSLLRYITIFEFQLLGGIGSTVGVVVYDVINLTFMMYICVQLKYLEDTLMMDCNESGETGKFSHFQLRQLEDKLKNCVNHHREILLFLKKLENFSTGPMFIQVLGIMIALCLISFEASTTDFNGGIESIMKTTMMAEYWSSIVVELFLYCYMSSKIGELALNISDAIYTCHWEQCYAKETIDLKSKQTIVKINYIIKFGILRAQRPVLMTAGPFYILCLPTFKALVGLSISNALILRQITNEDFQ